MQSNTVMVAVPGVLCYILRKTLKMETTMGRTNMQVASLMGERNDIGRWIISFRKVCPYPVNGSVSSISGIFLPVCTLMFPGYLR